MDERERFSDDEEAFRAAVTGVLKHLHFTHVSIVTQDSDGHNVVSRAVIRRRDVAPDGTVSFNDHPLLTDQPVHFSGGGGVVLTHALQVGNEIVSIPASRALDNWRQQGGVQNPAFPRMQSMSDFIAFAGVRSDPTKIQAVSTSSSQLRTDDGHHTVDHAPGVGTTIKSVDPSTPTASPSFTPFTDATKFINHEFKHAVGSVGSAVDGNKEHSFGAFHEIGSWLKATGSAGLNWARAHPVLGSFISAVDGKHSVTATLGGVMLQSKTAISFDCPPGGLELPSGGVNSSALAAGAASANVGPLSGDLGGTLPSPTVLSIANLVGMDRLPRAASDSAAAALTPPVAVGSPYLNTSIKTGVGVLAIRIV